MRFQDPGAALAVPLKGVCAERRFLCHGVVEMAGAWALRPGLN